MTADLVPIGVSHDSDYLPIVRCPKVIERASQDWKFRDFVATGKYKRRQGQECNNDRRKCLLSHYVLHVFSA
ncbi:hypothetical protein DGWBC_1592 [Dehalogenimonas sp. WBC-2]|nr:hypothetical protein DGWBC_1592 [Dehalogenimonas sp. WBC-2]